MGKKAEAIEPGKADGVYFGLMSGTSMDGVDGVAVQFAAGKPPVVLGEAHVSFPRACATRCLRYRRRATTNWNARRSPAMRSPRATPSAATSCRA